MSKDPESENMDVEESKARTAASRPAKGIRMPMNGSDQRG
jgi:hypothetical protein